MLNSKKKLLTWHKKKFTRKLFLSRSQNGRVSFRIFFSHIPLPSSFVNLFPSSAPTGAQSAKVWVFPPPSKSPIPPQKRRMKAENRIAYSNPIFMCDNESNLCQAKKSAFHSHVHAHAKPSRESTHVDVERRTFDTLYTYIERRQREEKNDDQIKTPAHALFSPPPQTHSPLNHPQTHSTSRQPNEINELLRRKKTKYG